MSFNCRFNPSANGAGLHLGHAYMALINEAVAHQSGGKFIVRFDDSSPRHEAQFGRARMDAAREQQRGELEWLGVKPDLWIKQTDIMPEIVAELARLNWHCEFGVYPIQSPMYPTDERLALFPCEPTITAEKVLMDHMEGINLLIRGIDLMTEFSLYTYCCKVFHLSEPDHVYLPRLASSNGLMSKHHGGITLADLRAQGYTPEDVRATLGEACLREPGNEWAIWNLKSEPRL